MTQEDAKGLAVAHLNQNYQVPGDELVILDSETIAKSYGWIFFYQSRRYLEHGEETDILAGNGPFVVREDGSCIQLGSAYPVEETIEQFERQEGLSGS
jgi:hypothetical protein